MNHLAYIIGNIYELIPDNAESKYLLFKNTLYSIAESILYSAPEKIESNYFINRFENAYNQTFTSQDLYDDENPWKKQCIQVYNNLRNH